MGPGFLVDESFETAGTGLQLPWWLESHREQIAKHRPASRLSYYCECLTFLGGQRSGSHEAHGRIHEAPRSKQEPFCSSLVGSSCSFV